MSLLKNTGKLAGATLFITGASRGIGKSIALKAAQDGANIVIAAKTAEPHPKLPGTIYTAAKEIEAAGGACLPCVVDIREEQQIQEAVDKAVEKFGGIDILVNNASAISLTNTLDTTMKRYDLMMDVNTRGTFLTSKLCLPHLLKSSNPHILNISPPLNMKPIWFTNHCAYTIAKYGMSLCVRGMSMEFMGNRVAVNALWPKTTISTAAIEMLMGESGSSQARIPEIMGDAAYAILTKSSRTATGQFFIDEYIVQKEGITDLTPYSVVPGNELMPDFFLDEAEKYVEVPSKLASPEDLTPASIFSMIEPLLNERIVHQANATFLFSFSGEHSGHWFLDLKNGSGSITKATENTKADVAFLIDSKVMVELFQGKSNATSAFMSGKLKVVGDMRLAMKLDVLLAQFRGKLKVPV